MIHGSEKREEEDYDSCLISALDKDVWKYSFRGCFLNVGSPASMSVHRDYYVYYGVEFRTVREIGIGMARENGDGPVSMGSLGLRDGRAWSIVSA